VCVRVCACVVHCAKKHVGAAVITLIVFNNSTILCNWTHYLDKKAFYFISYIFIVF